MNESECVGLVKSVVGFQLRSHESHVELVKAEASRVPLERRAPRVINDAPDPFSSFHTFLKK